jgi:hypothetical protein
VTEDEFLEGIGKIPKDRKPTVPEVLPFVNAYYAFPGNEAGGSLHVVLEDNNEDSAAWCQEWAKGRGDACGEALAEVMTRMSLTQVGKLAAKRGMPK